MTLNDSQRLDGAMRLIRAATGESYGEGLTVMDVGTGYAYGNDGNGRSDVWVSGDWNDRDRYDVETSTRVVVDTMPSRLAAALERIDVNVEWYDTVERCANCYRLISTTPGYYGDLPSYVRLDDGDTLCRDCIMEDVETIVDEHYANHVERAITWLRADELVEYGWHDAYPNDDDVQTGFHPGQNGSPSAMVSHLYADERNDGKDWVFLITDIGQFDMSYRLFVRNDENDDESTSTTVAAR